MYICIFNSYIFNDTLFKQEITSLKSVNMADADPISTDNQFLIEYYWEDLVKRIDICSSSLIDELLTHDIITQKQGEALKVIFLYT